MSQVAAAYNQNPDREWERLARDPYHTLEFLVTWHYLQKHLPPHGQILDAGGGPGRYALKLCQAGYEVVLLDISAGLISIAKNIFKAEPEIVQNRLLEVVVGDIRNLSHLETNRFDAVLCLGGPLTHISDEIGRHQALTELVRVARPGAVVCVSVMGYWAVLRTIMARFSDELVTPSLQTLVERGDTPGSTKTMWHFFRADELRQNAESCGLTTLEMAGCEGLSTGLAAATNILGQDETKWQRWVELVIKTSAVPTIVDMAEHILYIGRTEKA